MTRDDKGRFIKGHSGGPGRPARTVEETYLEAMRNVVTVEDWRAITTRAVVDAKKGDQAARKWLSDYLIGPPVQKNEHTGADGGPIEIVNDDAVIRKLLPELTAE